MRKTGKPGDPFWSPRVTSCDPDIPKTGGRPGLEPTSTLSSAKTRSIPPCVYFIFSHSHFSSLFYPPRGLPLLPRFSPQGLPPPIGAEGPPRQKRRTHTQNALRNMTCHIVGVLDLIHVLLALYAVTRHPRTRLCPHVFAFARWHGRRKTRRNAAAFGHSCQSRARVQPLRPHAVPTNSSRGCSQPSDHATTLPGASARGHSLYLDVVVDRRVSLSSLLHMLICHSSTVATHHGCNPVGGRYPHVRNHQGNPELDQ